jgi:hypothetical protein
MSSVSLETSTQSTGNGAEFALDQPDTNEPENRVDPALEQSVQDAASGQTPLDAELSDATNSSNAPEEAAVHEVASAPADELAVELGRLVQSISAVEELSRQARQAAVSDLAHYESLAASLDQYRAGLDQASQLETQASLALEQAFGQSARSAADSIVIETRRVRNAFGELVQVWQIQAETFLAEHPDVELLVAEQRAMQEDARRLEEINARFQRRDAIVAAFTCALDANVLSEASRALALFEREFPDEHDLLKGSRQLLRVAIREEKDLAAREALELAAIDVARGDLNTALTTLEAVDVEGLSLEVSKDVFGRWCDTCSRLAQESGAHLVRYAPQQGRGLILLQDPARPRELQVFSALGMGGDYPQNATISVVLTADDRRDGRARRRAAEAERILRGAHDFREAEATQGGFWATYATSGSAATPVHH